MCEDRVSVEAAKTMRLEPQKGPVECVAHLSTGTVFHKVVRVFCLHAETPPAILDICPTASVGEVTDRELSVKKCITLAEASYSSAQQTGAL